MATYPSEAVEAEWFRPAISKRDKHAPWRHALSANLHIRLKVLQTSDPTSHSWLHTGWWEALLQTDKQTDKCMCLLWGTSNKKTKAQGLGGEKACMRTECSLLWVAYVCKVGLRGLPVEVLTVGSGVESAFSCPAVLLCSSMEDCSCSKMTALVLLVSGLRWSVVAAVSCLYLKQLSTEKSERT